MVECRSWCLCTYFMSAFLSNMKFVFSKLLTWISLVTLNASTKGSWFTPDVNYNANQVTFYCGIQTYLLELSKWLNVHLDVRTTLEERSEMRGILE